MRGFVGALATVSHHLLCIMGGTNSYSLLSVAHLNAKRWKLFAAKTPTQTQNAERIRINRRVKNSFFIRRLEKNAAHVFVHFAKIQIEEIQFVVRADASRIHFRFSAPSECGYPIFRHLFFFAAIVQFSTVTLVAEWMLDLSWFPCRHTYESVRSLTHRHVMYSHTIAIRNAYSIASTQSIPFNRFGFDSVTIGARLRCHWRLDMTE